jgi:hypothetical protein
MCAIDHSTATALYTVSKDNLTNEPSITDCTETTTSPPLANKHTSVKLSVLNKSNNSLLAKLLAAFPLVSISSKDFS